MPSDRPPPEPSAPGSDPAGRKRTTAAVRDGTLVFAAVLSGFVAYALGAQATYRASAVVAVEPVSGARPATLPKAEDATERLRRAALDTAIVAKLASEEHPVPPDTTAQAGERLSQALSVESTDGLRFTFATTATTAERAQRVVNGFAEQAAKRAAQVLDPSPAIEVDPGAKAKAALLDFLAAHPSIASEPEPTPVRPGRDPLILALKAERLRIEQKLANPTSEPSTDNPYEAPTPLENPDFLKRRLKEIDTALEARSKPKPATDAGTPSSPEVRAEWQRLLRAVSETKGVEPVSNVARLRVTLARAALPQRPIDPDRPRLVLLGVLLASIAGVLAGFFRGFIEARTHRRYGITTGKHPVAPMPQTTLRLEREQLPKPLAPKSGPLPTPVPEAPPNPSPITPIPPAPLAPSLVTSIPPAPLAPTPITPIPPAPIVPITPVPPPITVLGAKATATPIPPAEPKPMSLGDAAAKADVTLISATASAEVAAEVAAAAAAEAPLAPVPPMVVAGPAPIVDGDGPPTTIPYPNPELPAEPEPAPRTKGAARRITQIYGTPPPPADLQADVKALRTTQSYGSPPAALAKQPPNLLAYNPTPIPAEVLPPHKSSLRPSPMIPLARSSSIPPAVAPSNRSGAPLAETGYSYVATPVPEAHSIPQTPYPRRSDSIPQTPPPRMPSPPPRTEPYGSLPPVQPKRPPSDPPVADPNRARTPIPPNPELKPQASVVRTHPVLTSWRPDAKLAPGSRRQIAGEILTLAANGCFVVGVTGLRGLAQEKSRAAVEIAFALSEAKHPRILLVEGDFHFPEIQNWLKLDVPLSAGFSQQLRARIQGQKEGRWHIVECLPSLHVLAEGVMRSPGLLLSNQFEQAMRELRSHYDVIVIDAPLAPGDAESRAIADVTDGILVVASKARSNEVNEIGAQFPKQEMLRTLES